MTTGSLLREVQELLGKAADTLRFAGEIEAGIARAAGTGELECLWRPGFGAF